MRKISVLLLVLAVASSSFALTLPGWIGGDRTVHAEWQNWEGNYNQSEEYYEASSWQSVGDGLYDYIPYVTLDSSVTINENGNLTMNGMGYSMVDFFVPNFTGGDSKEVFIQIEYNSSSAPLFGVDAYIGGEQLTEGLYGPYFQESEDLGNGWVIESYIFNIEPNPEYEYITLGFESGYSAEISKVVIDTVCIPEPATIGLIALGSVVMFRKRK